MANPREIRRRIRSVKNIVQVTSALEAVSASKVRRAQAQVLATRAYAGAAMEILRDVASHQGGTSHELLEARAKVNNIGLVLITSDRGLAGPYNSNVVRAATDFWKSKDVPVQFVTVGRKGRDLIIRRGGNVVSEFSDMPAAPSILDITPITRGVVDDFLNGVLDEVHIVYTDYVNTIVQVPRVLRWLPLQSEEVGQEEPNASAGSGGPSAVYSFEPDGQAILDEILPRFTELQLYQAILESLASEHSARMVAMRNATESGNSLVDDLTLSLNKARQLQITSEMLDIVGGAEALAQSE